MKKFLFALIVSLLVASTSFAEIKTFTGTDEYTIGETETQADAKERSRQRAMRNAQEQAGVYIRSYSEAKDFELVRDEVVTITAGVLKVVGAPDYKVRVLDDGKSTLIVTTLTVQIDTDDIDRRLKQFESPHKKDTPPVDRPKPIEQPKPQPVEEPKPEKVEPQPEKIEQPAEESAPVEEPKPAEPIEPTPVEEPTQTEEPAPRGEVKFFEIDFGTDVTDIESIAKDRLHKEMVAFVVKHCKAQNLNITEEQALAAVDFSSKVINVRYNRGSGVRMGVIHGYKFFVNAKGLLYMGKLDAWIKNHDA